MLNPFGLLTICMFFPYFRTFEEEKLQNNPLSTVKHIWNQPPYKFLQIFKTFTRLKFGNKLICLLVASTKFAHNMNQNLICSTKVQNFSTIIDRIVNAFWTCEPNPRDDSWF